MNFGQFLDIVEIRTKVVGVSTFLLGTLYAVYAEGRFEPALFILMGISVLCVDMGTTAFNTYFDFVRGTDSRAFNRERDKVLVHRGVPPSAALSIALSLYAAAVFTGFAIADMTGPFTAAAGVLGIAVGFFYTGGPIPISRTPFGELFAGGFLGTVLFQVSYYVQAGRVTADSWLASIPLLLTIASILTVNNTCDITGDAASGRKTLSILVGRKWGEVLALLLNLSGQLSVFALAAADIFPPGVLPTAGVSLAYAAAGYFRMHRRGLSHETKGFSMKTIAGIFFVFSLCLASGIVVPAFAG